MRKALITSITSQGGSYLAEMLLKYEEYGIVRRSSFSDLELSERGAVSAVSRHADA